MKIEDKIPYYYGYVFYFDSSALVKLYAEENGTDLVREIRQQKDTVIFLSDIAVVEFGATLARKLRERIITEDEYTTMVDDFMDDYMLEYTKVEINIDVLSLAVKLAKKNALKAYDAVQLACAIKVRSEIEVKENMVEIAFVVADKTLEKAAQVEGFITINPETFSR